MNKLSRALDEFCYKHSNWGISGLMRYIITANIFVFLMDMFSQNSFSSMLDFRPYQIFYEGQVWRLITFALVPTNGFGDMFDVLWFTISSMCYFFIGSALEQRWGSTRFTLFYGLGVILNLLAGLFIGVLAWSQIINPIYMFAVPTSMYYVNMSLFFSIATLYPNLQFYFWFIIPVKAKWMGWLSAGFIAYDILRFIASGNYAFAFVPVLALFNYILFFWDGIAHFLFKTNPSSSNQRSRPMGKTVDIKTASKQVQKQKGYLHKCTVCGITDATNPEMDFRYCSKCDGYHCYCMNHINNHEHVKS